MKKFTSVVLGFSFLVLAGCSTNAPVTNNTVGSVKKEQVVTVRQGTVTAVKDVAIQGRSSGAGSTVGSITGSLIGSTVPVAGSIIGSLLGSAVGGEAEKTATKQAALEITLQLEGGDKVVVTQLAETKFKPGDKVKLTMTDNKAQVSHLQDNS